MLASKRGDLELVKLLVHHGADLNAGDADGKTALDYAEERRRKEIADFLLARGAKRSGT
jgi:ankyrin repeat protein